MPPIVIDLRSAEDLRDVVHRAVQALAEGKLVAMPTETVYGLAVSARDEGAVERLLQAKGRGKDQPFSLAVKGIDDALDYVPRLSSLGRRLARRCWPGPVTLVLENDHPDSLLQRLPASVRELVSPAGTVGLRVPAHQLVLDVLQLTAGPLVLTSANRSGESDSLTAAEVVDSMGEDVQLVLDDGSCQFGQPSSVVRVVGDDLDILRAGVVSETTLRRLSSLLILLVCTGNTCRSPLAEAFMRRRLADILKCDAEQLDDRGVMVMSAGIAAMAGGRASTHSMEVAAQRGLDLSGHESQPLTDRLVQHADLILTMTASHRDAILAQWPSAAPRTEVLSTDGSDVADPIGGPVELYRSCADQIDGYITERSREIDVSTLIPVDRK
jgi:protein-tyrosine phosphatase